MKRCDECIYSHLEESVHAKAGWFGWLGCRRFPPIIDKDDDGSNFPVVKIDEFCGEFKSSYSTRVDEAGISHFERNRKELKKNEPEGTNPSVSS